MTRREFTKATGAALAASIIANRLFDVPRIAMADDHIHGSVPSGRPQQIGMLLYPAMTAQDLIGPHLFFAGLMNVKVHLLWKSRDLVTSDQGISIQPTTTLNECPKDLDIVFVPGGSRGTIAMMRDTEVLAFLADRGSRARYVISVCTGSLVLGAAGLLKGYRATSHWYVRDLLPLLGAVPVDDRVVIDRNRITGAGVTAGLDLGLMVSEKMRDAQFAKIQQLAFEYDPQPQFRAGNPKDAGPELTGHLQKMMASNHERARIAALEAHNRLSAAKA
jgi:cyclohexyl-isocyanide hydratase